MSNGMELRHLRYFVAVGEELSFSRAAKRLHTAQPSLSQQIKDLEREVGCALLERDRHHVALTAAGTTFLSEARLTLAQAQRAGELARQATRSGPNQIRLGLLPGYEAFFLVRILPVLSTQMPELSLSLRGLSSAELLTELRRGTIDIALTRAIPGDERFASETVRDEPLMAVVPSRHRWAKLKSISLRQLAKERWVLPSLNAAGFDIRRTVNLFLEREQLQPISIHETDNVLTNLILVGSGIGVALLPQYVEEMGVSTVSCKPVTGTTPTVRLLMVYERDSSSPILKRFLELLRGMTYQPE